MTDRLLAPWQVWWINFDPQVGREQAGLRPAIVVGSPLACDLPNSLAIVLPCTTVDRGLPIHPAVDLGRPSFAMCDQVRSVSVDRMVRQHPARVTNAEIDLIRFVLRQMLDLG